jgi:hypothetical protein
MWIMGSWDGQIFILEKTTSSHSANELLKQRSGYPHHRQGIGFPFPNALV